MIETLVELAGPLGGVLIGFVLGRRERNLKRLPTSPYTCDCGHVLSLHTEKGRCRHKAGKYDECDCQKYVGHRPMEIEA